MFKKLTTRQRVSYIAVALLLIAALFRELGFRKVILDTDVQNKRAQHVYERLGFRRARVRENAWRDQLGQMRSYVDYEVIPEYFINFAE